MAVNVPPPPRDVQDFVFKQARRLKVFEGGGKAYDKPVNLLAVGSRFGLVFVGCTDELAVLRTEDIIAVDDCDKETRRTEATQFPCQRVALPGEPTHIGLSCDHLTLSVVVIKSGCPHAFFYDVRAFINKMETNIRPFLDSRLSSNPNTHVVDMMWNSALPDLFVVCISDGSITVVEVKGKGVNLHSVTNKIKATCLCWSPKGKQLVVGNADGTLTQYKPDLKEVKRLPAPLGVFQNPVTVVSILWISNYLFMAAYKDVTDNESPPCTVLVSTPKNGNVIFSSYEDIFFCQNQPRPPQLFMLHQPDWSIIICASSNAVDTGVFGPVTEDKSIWQLWLQEDSARASLPLVHRTIETFPTGMGLDTSVQRMLPWGDSKTLPPMPLFYLLSTVGTLCPFHAINLQVNAPQMCKPLEMIPTDGLRLPLSDALATPTTARGGASNKMNLMDKFNEGVPAIPTQPSFFGGPSFAASPSLNSSTSFFGKLGSTSTPLLVPPKVPESGSGVQQLPKSLLGNHPASGVPTASIASAKSTSPNVLPQPKFFGSLAGQQAPMVAPTVASVVATAVKPVQSIPKPTAGQGMKREPGGTLKENTSLHPATARKSTPPPTATSSAALSRDNFIQATVEEIQHFDRELRDFKEKAHKCNFKVGEEKEKEELAGQVQAMILFQEKVKETTVSLKKEVEMLRGEVVEGFRCTEEARSRKRRDSDGRYKHLLRCRPLDPLSSRQMGEIRQLENYLEQQLQVATKKMADDLEDFELAKMNLKRNYLPTMEALYQSLKNNVNILEAQQNMLDHLSKKIKATLRSWCRPEISETDVETAELSQLADTFLKVTMSPMNQLNATNQPSPTVKFAMNSPVKKVSPEKQAILRNFLSQQPVMKVRPTRSAGNNTSHFLLMKAAREPIKLTLEEDKTQLQLQAEVQKGEGEQLQEQQVPTGAEVEANESNDIEGADIAEEEEEEYVDDYEDLGSNVSPIPVTPEESPPPTPPSVPVAVTAPSAAKPFSLFQMSGFAPVKSNAAVSIFGGSGSSASPLGALSNMVSSVGGTTAVEPAAATTTSLSKPAFSFSLPASTANQSAASTAKSSFTFSFPLPKPSTAADSVPAEVTSTSVAATAAPLSPTAYPFTSFHKQVAGQPKIVDVTTLFTTPTNTATPVLSALLSTPVASAVTTAATPASTAFTLTKSAPFDFAAAGLTLTPVVSESMPASKAPATTISEVTISSTAVIKEVTPPKPIPKEKPQETAGTEPALTPEETATSPAAITTAVAAPTSTVSTTAITTAATTTTTAAPVTTTASSLFFSLPPTSTESTATTVASNVFATAVSNFTFGQPAKPVASTFSFAPTTTAAASTESITTAPSASTFGSSLFGSATAFGGSSQPGSMFGGTAFAASKPVFGQTSTFGQQSGAAPAFGSPTSGTFGSSPVFGQSTFGQTSTASSTASNNLFGSSGGFFSGLGGTPSAENANRNVFGGGSVFGASSQANSGLFGNTASPGFSTATSSGAVTGSFSAGGSPVAVAGFVPPSPSAAQPGAFGGSPSFGGAATFGSTAAFGGSPTFGSSPTFGNSANFGNFAAANTPTFGSLAQQGGGSPAFGSLATPPSPQQQQPSASGGFGAIATQQPPAFGTTFGGGAPAQPFGGAPSSSGESFGGASFGQSESCRSLDLPISPWPRAVGVRLEE